MYGKRNKNKNKNYYRKSVFCVILIKSVGIDKQCVPNCGFKKCHVTDYNVI